MVLPIGMPLNLPVDVIDVRSPALRTHSGQLTQIDDDRYQVEIPEAPSGLGSGARVVLHLRDGDERRVSGVIETTDGPQFIIRQLRAVTPDQRYSPRLAGGVPLRYRVVSPTDPPDLPLTWMDGDDDGGPEQLWRRPDPLMNFSVNGLRFDDEPICDAGDVLLCEFGVGGDPTRWRGTAEVVRVEPLPDPENADATHSVAIRFLQLPTPASEALTEYTLRLQRAAF